MSRKIESPNPVNLKALRGQIDKFDVQILDLLNKRASVASQIGKVKSEQGGDVFSASREEEVLSNILDANKGPLAEVSLRADFPRTHLRLAGDSESSKGRLPRAGVQL